MKVYLDNCCFNRPYDNQDHLSIKLETEAKLRIQEMIKEKKLLLIWSFMRDYENSANPGTSKRHSIYEWHDYSSAYISFKDDILRLSQKIAALGFGKKDSIHLSCAITGKSEYFITVDNGMLYKNNSISDIKIIDPISFIRIMEETI